MGGKRQIYKWGDRKKILLLSIIFFSLIAGITLTLSTPSDTVVYVASNGSGDFNCDGTDDQVEINKALAYVAENPQFTTVRLQGPNTYVISNSVYIGSDTVLEGDPTVVIKLEDKAGWPLEKPLITQMDSAGNNNIVIRGFEIDGNHDNNNEKSRGKGYYNLINFLNCENIKVHDIYMHDSHGDGLKVIKCSGIQFYNNRVYKLGHDALYAIYSSNVEAWNNKITCRTNSGLRVYNTNHVKFHNNIIDSEGEGGAGIEIQKIGPSTVMNDIEICNNLLYETNAAGVWITGYGSGYSKDSARDIYIHHNKFYKSGINPGADWAGGIVLNGFQNTLIENNKFEGCYGAAIAHKQVTEEFLAPGTGYTTLVRNNIIMNTRFSPAAGEGYAIYNKLENTHSFNLENNCLSNNAGGNYLGASSTSDIEADPELAAKLNKNESLGEDFPWIEAMSAGPQTPYEIDESRIPEGQGEDFKSSLQRIFSEFLRSLKRFFLSLSMQSDEIENFKIALPFIISDNRLRQEAPNMTLSENEYIDIGKKSDGGIYRGVILFDLNSFNQTDRIEKATLSLFWYYPENQTRTKDTVLEVYRPVKWCEEHVTWQQRETNIPWKNSGGDWYDRNEVFQGSTPYATVTISGDEIPDNRYYELDITELIQEYASEKHENTGFLIKAREEDGNYIAFYSSNWQDKSQRPKLTIEYA
ncbi:DNRLRE domain-containing protein [Methanosarcina sp. MSH10X1]|uniref:disaggregatase related repeat-containing protein n=1 Tax=Methanosarcina sp. MSH10X1 TaxID=2507075 RepID=UPI000FFBC094|nr:disaggregatase related repeat-containing protein [Methanosarcina sp. MSH10X1]RXA18039.1 DNRLRE domain-containing protein [Methanosarcina sp. MSH10X1]